MTITAADLVNREVGHCVSFLVATLADNAGGLDSSETSKAVRDMGWQAFELAGSVPDYEEAATQEGWKHVGTQADRCMVFSKGTSITGADSVCASTWAELCEMEDIEPYQREVFEHWIVSDWLADKLIEKGEKVDKDFAGLCVWARTTTGQAISIDSVIEEIRADLVKG